MKRWGGFFAVMVGVLSALGYSYHSYESEALKGAYEAQSKASRLAIQSVDDSLHQLTALSEQVTRIDRNSLSHAEVLSRLCEMMKAEPRLHQIGFAVEPSTAPDQQRFGPYCVREDGKPKQARLEDIASYDYTIPNAEHEWYFRAKRDGDGWSVPYYDRATGAVLAEHTRPLRAEGGGFAGVAFASYSLTTLTNLVKNLDLGRSGYAFIITRGGQLLSYPNRSDVSQGRTLQHLAVTHHSPGLLQINSWAQHPQGDSLFLQLNDPMTQAPSWAWCSQLSKTGWVMCTLTPTGSALNMKELAKRRLTLVLAVMFFAIVALAMLLKAGVRQPQALWALSLTSTALLSGAVGYCWYLAYEGSLNEAHVPAIVSSVDVDHRVQINRARLREVHHREDLSVVPTGIHISQITTSERILSLTGILWQRYHKQHQGEAPPETGPRQMTVLAAGRSAAPQEEADALPPSVGVAFPGALSVEMEELFRKEVAGEQVIGWSFKLELPEQFDAKDFPLDRGNITLDVVPKAFDEPVLLVPDLASYDNIVTSALPGVGSTLGLPGWQLEESSFSHKERTINSDLGLAQVSLFRDVLTLQFTIGLRRVFTNPFIIHVMPLTILLFLMFAVLMLTSRREGLAERLGFNASAIIGAYGTFFFIAVLQHVSLRESMGTSQLVYFEWFYILVYVQLLLLSLNALLFSANTEVKFILFEDNLWPKLLYGPLTAAGALIATCFWFF
jgi:preprotein translocase subunit SecG